jgi:hypothetical protein
MIPTEPAPEGAIPVIGRLPPRDQAAKLRELGIRRPGGRKRHRWFGRRASSSRICRV